MAAQGGAWIPASVSALALIEVGILRRKTAATQMWAVYDLIGATFVTALDADPERTLVQLDGPRNLDHELSKTIAAVRVALGS